MFIWEHNSTFPPPIKKTQIELSGTIQSQQEIINTLIPPNFTFLFSPNLMSLREMLYLNVIWMDLNMTRIQVVGIFSPYIKEIGYLFFYLCVHQN